MKVLLEYKGLKLIQRYNKFYIRFIGGQMTESICEFQIADDEANEIFANNSKIVEIKNLYKKTMLKTIEGIPKIIEIIPQINNSYSVNVIVELPDVKLKADNNIYMSIDFGINNLMTAYISSKNKSFIISGRQLLSINRYFDKKIAYYQGIYDKQQKRKLQIETLLNGNINQLSIG